MNMARMNMSLCLAFIVASGAIFQASGTLFLLPHYLKKMPRFSKDVEPFAYKGITTYMHGLQKGCPETSEFKTFFSKLQDYMNTVNSVSQMSGSMDATAVQSQMKGKAEGLYTAISHLSGGSSGSAEAKKMFETVQSLGKTLMEQRRSSSSTLSADQQRAIQVSISKCAQGIGQFVSSAAQKNGGNSIDFSAGLNVGSDSDNDDDITTSSSAIGRRGSAGGASGGSSFSMGGGRSSFGASSGSASGGSYLSGGSSGAKSSYGSGSSSASGSSSMSGGSFRSGSYGSSYDSSEAAARGSAMSGSYGQHLSGWKR
ncbi:PREDICTED: keratin, type II cytoskeletal 2 epidermal-like [Tarenaya hassleriana]|uniref:keratin, type II cytoskeletal 2 epidermal-like n=1 Tax=Tarenaya hassleriana TaxID=28532 RepID=UPI00053C2F72|nr:PREDICTED: keratin, type II cytoskeletal 2 epidermal-like [Tarenaya hassleriana]